MSTDLDSTGPGTSYGAAALVVWEPPGPATADAALMAARRLAAAVGPSVACIGFEITPRFAGQIGDLVGIGLTHGVRFAPIVRADHALPDSGRPAPEIVTALRLLASADRLARFRGAVPLLVANSPNAASRVVGERIATAWFDPGQPIRLIWCRSSPRSAPAPTEHAETVEWPPFDDVLAGSTPAEWSVPYDLLVADLARRTEANSAAMPSVIWSAERTAQIREGLAQLTRFSDLKHLHALDAAARFTHNRRQSCAPYWVLRAAFNPDDPEQVARLEQLARQLSQKRAASVSLPGVATPIALPPHRSRTAVVVHVFYPDLWPELALQLQSVPRPFDVYVSCPHRLVPALRPQILDEFPFATVFGVQNLGRDVLPFLHWLRATASCGYEYVLKLHTKKSAHLSYLGETPLGSGDSWRRKTIAELIGCGARILSAFDTIPGIGMVAAAGTRYDQVAWQCATRELHETLLARLGARTAIQGTFAAGTMFWARMSALTRLTRLTDAEMDFERESWQVDGTLHHAYERAFPLVVADAGFHVIDTALLPSA